MTDAKRPLAWDEDAEVAVLSAMLLNERGVEAALAALDAKHFYREGDQVVFSVIRGLYQDGKPVDAITVRDAVSGHERADELKVRVSALAASFGVPASVPHHATIVREMWARRRVHRIAAVALDQIAASVSVEETLAMVETELLDLRGEMDVGRKTVFRWFELAEAWEQKMKNPPVEEPGFSTPWPGLSNRPGGRLVPGRLYVVGGYTGDGKSIVALQLCLHVAQRHGVAVGLALLEMTWKDMLDRAIAALGLPYGQAVSGRVRENWQEAARKAIATMAQFRGGVVDDASADAARLRTYQRLGGYDLFVIDHLHRIEIEDTRHYRLEFEKQVRACSMLARMEDIPVVLVSQLHRSGDNFPRPTLASFRESGVIEQEAAAAWAVWRNRDAKKQPEATGEFLVLKNRFGMTYDFPIQLNGDRLSYEETAVEPGVPE